MKKLKFILTVALALCTAGLFAQLAEMGTTSFGVRAGVNFQNLNGEDDTGDKLENDLVARWHAGVNVDIPIAPDFYIQPGVMFILKGAKNDDELFGQTVTSKLSLGYVEVPLHLVYKPVMGTGKMLLGLGPYVGYGVTGKYKIETSNGNETELDVEFQGEVDEGDSTEDAIYIKPLDYGANLFAGYEFANMFSFQVNTQLGLANILPDVQGVDSDAKTTNTGFGVSLGLRF